MIVMLTVATATAVALPSLATGSMLIVVGGVVAWQIR